MKSIALPNGYMIIGPSVLPPRVTRELAYDCKKNQVTIDLRTPSMEWFHVHDANHVTVGFGGFDRKTGRIKCDYIRPEYRNQGLYDALMKIRLEHAKQLGLSRVTGFFNKNSVHCALKNGFEAKSVNKNNVTFCEKLL